MLSSVPERKMLYVRSLLLMAWLTLIMSLFWDPYSAGLTGPVKETSPLSVAHHAVIVQGVELRVEPYALGTRVFWTIVIPIMPLFLIVFGHEAWRRVCPLSLASQIPGLVGLQRYSRKVDRRTGAIRKTPQVISRQSWLARNSWYVQFGLLFIGIVARILVINADRKAMAIASLSIISAAFVTGFLWGGKTWCNYFCPANIVQKIYTEPGGILESHPHHLRPKLPQSMCRKATADGDIGACVGCVANCGDIDLQRAYWSDVLDPQRRNVYYMFFGLIIGFYEYYYLYAGSWDYYFSGVWTHEEGIWEKLLKPGFYLFGQAWPMPKVCAAPLTLVITCTLSLVLGRTLEKLHRRWRSRDNSKSEILTIHHCLTVASWSSFNCFYVFGGQPNIILLPELAGRVIDIIIVVSSTIWLYLVVHQNPCRYQHESRTRTAR